MICTGNEYIAIPEIEENSDVLSINVLSMAQRGMIEFRGGEKPFLHLGLSVNGTASEFSSFTQDRYWIPTFSSETPSYSATYQLLSPKDQKGFVQVITVQNKTEHSLEARIGLTGSIAEVLHTVNESKLFEGSMHAYATSWSDCPCFDIRSGFPVLALAPITSTSSNWTYSDGSSISFTMETPLEVPASGDAQFAIYWGVGYEEVSAVTSAREFSRQGVETLYQEQICYLDSIIKPTGDTQMDTTLFKNLLFAIHYATGRTIDTEELVLVTSRSPRYYVSAAYWDRDSLLWSFPAILEVDQALAREMLSYVSTRQKRNVGIHSRYIDGTILEPGFELDELCAPILAIDAYYQKTSEPILEDSDIKSLTNRIIGKLEAVETETGLYKTFLQPTDDMHVYPMLTYNNALVHAVFSILASWNWNGKASHWTERKEAVKRAIEMYLVKDHQGKRQYVWSTDGNGNYDIYDEPPGSLLLLPLFGITSLTDEVYLNTVSTITDPAYEYSFAGTNFAAIGCPHAPHPWILSLANEVRVLHTEASIQKLLHAPMDHGIACESIDEHTGYATTGEAFATCAGYLSYVLIGEMKARGNWKA